MKILLVCLGNICRSAMAEGILRSKVDESVQVISAGTIDMHQGKQPDERAIAAAKNHGIDISRQQSSPITPDYIRTADYVLCMDKNNLRDVQAMVTDEAQLSKIRLMLDFPTVTGEDVVDPYWGTAEDFEKAYRLLDTACDRIVTHLNIGKC